MGQVRDGIVQTSGEQRTSTAGRTGSRLLSALVGLLMVAVLLPPSAADGSSATEKPVEGQWPIQRTIGAETTEEAAFTVTDEGLLELATSSQGASEDEELEPTSVTQETSATNRPGEWPMGNRDAGRTGDAAWQEFISVPVTERWSVQASDKVQVNPAVAGGMAYVGGAGADRRVYAIELHTGDIRWQVELPGSVLSAPAVTDHFVYVGAMDGRVYKLSRADGSLAWQFPGAFDAPLGGIVGGPVVDDGIVYFGSLDGNVYAVDAETGSLVWAAPTPERVSAGVTVVGGRLLVMSGANEWITALDVEDGSQLWQRHLYDFHDPNAVGTAASADAAWGRAYFTGLDGNLYSLWLSSGQDAAAPVDLGAFAQNTPVLTSQGVFVGTNNGRVHGFDRALNSQWSTWLPQTGIVSSPVHAAGLLFAASTDGTLYALDAGDGALEGGFATGGSLLAPPAIVSNHVLLGSDDHHLYALAPGLPSNQTHDPEPFDHYARGWQPVQAYESDPISTSTGNFLYTTGDHAYVGGPGIPAFMERTYNSLGADDDGPFGHGWTMPWATSLEVGVDEVVVHHGDGRQDTHRDDGAGGYEPPPTVADELVETTDGFRLTTKERVVWHFDATGALNAIEDRSGNMIEISRDADGHIEALTDASGRTLALDHNAEGRVTQVSDVLGRTWQYRYDAAGNLIEAEDPSGAAWTYDYDANHLMTRITDPDGDLVLDNVYDPSGRVVEQTDAEGATWQFDYGADSTIVTDPHGEETVYEFDDNWRTTRITAADGGVTEFVYDAASNLVATVDPLERERRFAHDDRGNLVAELDPLGHKTAYEYDSDDNLVAVTDLHGNVTSLDFDDDGRLTAITRPSGATTELSLRPDGLPEEITDPTGASGTLQYDSAGLLSAVTDPEGRTTTFDLDAAGQLQATTDPTGATTSYVLDDRGLLVEVTDPLGHTTSFTHRGDGLLTSVTDANGQTTTYDYDARGLLVATTDPLGRTTTKTYDAARRLVAHVDPRGHQIDYEYDAVGRLTRLVVPDHTDIVYDYDLAGQVVGMTDATGTTSYDYDLGGRLIAEHVGHAQVTVGHDYDALSRRLSVAAHRSTGELLAFNRFAYDPDGQVVSVVETFGGETTLDYDLAGRLAQIDHFNGITTNYAYDDAGQLVDLFHDDPAWLLSRWSYDYDDAGRRVAATRTYRTEAGPVEIDATYDYDAAGRLIAATTNDPAAPPTANATFSYDAVGNRTEVAPLGSVPITYTFDAANQLVADTLTSYEHDQAGNLVAREPLGAGAESATYQWNALGQLTAISTPSEEISYSYDGAGRRVGQESETDVARLIFDGTDLLVEEVDKPLITTWAAQASVGPMVLSRSALGGRATLHPDGTGNVGELADETSLPLARYSYAPYGERARVDAGSVTDPVLDRHTYSGAWGVREAPGGLLDMRNRLYDPALGQFISRDPLENLTRQPYQYAAGNPISMVDPYGLFPWSAGWCPLGDNADGSCRGTAAVSAVRDIADTELAQTTKDIASTVSTGAAGAAAITGTATAVCPLCPWAPFTGAATGALGKAAFVSGATAAVIGCLDRTGTTRSCAAGMAATGIGRVGTEAIRQLPLDDAFMVAAEGQWGLFTTAVGEAYMVQELQMRKPS